MTQHSSFETRDEVMSRLARENAFYRIAERLAGIGHLVYDIPTGRADLSDTLRDLLGQGAARPSTLADFLSQIEPTDRERMSAALAADGPDDIQIDFSFTREDDGRQRCGQLRGEVEREGSGRRRRLVAVVRDVTAARAAERVARTVERRLTQSDLPEPVAPPAHGDALSTAPPTPARGRPAVGRPPGH